MNLPDSKTGARRIPLSAEAVQVLESLPRVAGNEYVIAGEIDGQHLTDLQRPWRRIRKLAGLEHVRIHDLRHTYASNGLMQGVSIAMVGKLLGHSQIQTTMRYVHLVDDPVPDAVRQVAALIGKSLTQVTLPEPLTPARDANVLKFRAPSKASISNSVA